MCLFIRRFSYCQARHSRHRICHILKKKQTFPENVEHESCTYNKVDCDINQNQKWSDGLLPEQHLLHVQLMSERDLNCRDYVTFEYTKMAEGTQPELLDDSNVFYSRWSVGRAFPPFPSKIKGSRP